MDVEKPLIQIGKLFDVSYGEAFHDEQYQDVHLISSTGERFSINRTVLACSSQVCTELLLDLYKCPIANSEDSIHISTNLTNDDLTIILDFFTRGILPSNEYSKEADLSKAPVFSTFGIDLEYLVNSSKHTKDNDFYKEFKFETDISEAVNFLWQDKLKTEHDTKWELHKGFGPTKDDLESPVPPKQQKYSNSKPKRNRPKYSFKAKSTMYTPFDPPAKGGQSKAQALLFFFPQEGSRDYNFKYQCGRCIRSFNGLPDYRQHYLRHNMQIQDTKAAFSCIFCFNYNCGSNQDLEEHRRTECPVEKFDDEESMFSYYCAFCPDNNHYYQSTKSLTRHLAEIHPDQEKALFRTHICAACGAGYPDATSLSRHYERQGPFHDNHCTICMLDIQSWEEHRAHVTHDHDGNFRHKCGLCGACSFDTVEQMTNHRKFCKHIKYMDCPMTENPKIALCTICSREVDGSVFHIRKHFMEFHPEHLHMCQTCGRGFSSETLLKMHMKRDHVGKEEQYPCQLCDKIFKVKSSLKTHLFSVHSSNDQKPYKCELCNAGFGSKAGLRVHIKIHKRGDEARVKSRVCEICGTSVTENGYLKHLRRQHGEATLPCDQCDMVFKHITPLNVHKRTMHTFVTCEECGEVVKGGSYKSHKLRRHTSNELMPHLCHVCDPPKGFATKQGLNDHNNIHTGERPYPCKYCSRTFTNSSNRTKHVKQAHREVIQQPKMELQNQMPESLSLVPRLTVVPQ